MHPNPWEFQDMHPARLKTLQVTKLCDLCPNGDQDPQDSVCSVSWSQRGTYLSVGTNTGSALIWDVARAKMCAPYPLKLHSAGSDKVWKGLQQVPRLIQDILPPPPPPSFPSQLDF
jgi:WD40 repeat protein